MNEPINYKKEPKIYWTDVYQQKQSLILLELNENNRKTGEYSLRKNSEINTEVNSVEKLQKLIGKPESGISSALVYKYLLFIKVTKNVWSVHYKEADGGIIYIDNIDFTPFIEHDLFVHLIEILLRNPDNYYSYSCWKYKGIPTSYGDLLIRDYLDGNIVPSMLSTEEEEIHPKDEDLNSDYINSLHVIHGRKELPLIDLHKKKAQCIEGNAEEYDNWKDYKVTVEIESVRDLCAIISHPDIVINQGLVFGTLLFIKITQSVWAVHWIAEEVFRTSITGIYFESIDFEPYIESGLFNLLIAGMARGPEYYWRTKKDFQVRKKSLQRHNATGTVINKFLDGSIEPSERMKEQKWVQNLIHFNRDKMEAERLRNNSVITLDDRLDLEDVPF